MRSLELGVICSFVAVLLGIAVPARAQGYSVAAALNPFFIHPETGEDVTSGVPLKIQDWERGADGRFYGVLIGGEYRGDYGFDDPVVFQVIQVTPTTGAVRVLVVGFSNGGFVSPILRGLNGRLYFTVLESTHYLYTAPGYVAEDCSSRGCVLVIDTGSPGQPIRWIYGFERSAEGWYPSGLSGEDLDGNLYVYTRDGRGCDPDYDVLVRIKGMDDTEVLCDFDWSSITLTDNRWRWSDGRTYYATHEGGVFQHIAPSTTTQLAAISPAHGVPFGGLVEGSGYLYGVTSGGGPLGGGVVFRIRMSTLAGPDLQVSSLSAPPATIAPGGTFTVVDTITNAGPEPSAASANLFFLSRTGNSRDFALSNKRYIGELAGGEVNTGSRAVKVPTSVLQGVYFLMACADGSQEVPESREDNNCVVSDSQVTVAQPDFVQSAVSVAAATAMPLAKIATTDTVGNASVAIAPASTTYFFLSTDATKSPDDLALAGKRSVPDIPAGGGNTGTVSVTIPSGAAGAYYIVACADATAKVQEFDESNNCSASAVTILIGKPDLVISQVGEPPASATPGGKITVSDTTRNAGGVPTRDTTTRYWLSLNTSRDGNDILLSGGRSVPALGGGEASSASRQVIVPASAPPGSYYVLACSDDTSKVTESSETNNCTASIARVGVGWPDLVISSLSSPPASVAAGGKFAISDTATNQGTVYAIPSSTRYYLSLDATKSAGDIALSGTRAIGGLAPGAASSGGRTLTVPAPRTVGTYYLLACADDTGKVGESDDSNNCRAASTVVTIH